MARVKRGVTAHAKHKKVYKAAKGYYGRRKNTIRVAKQAVEKANQYAFRDRKRRKRTFRALWIQRLNAAVRPFGLNYSSSSTGWPRPASRSTARCCRISPSTSRRRSRRSSRRPRPRCRRRPRQSRPRRRHARPRAGHPRLTSLKQDVDGRDKPGHDAAMNADAGRHVRHRAARTTKSSPPSPRPTTKRRWRRCASPRSARAARCRRC